eukprot:SAG11_NODE_7872_length_1086_cov_0.885512_1_plen_99_part_00
MDSSHLQDFVQDDIEDEIENPAAGSTSVEIDSAEGSVEKAVDIAFAPPANITQEENIQCAVFVPDYPVRCIYFDYRTQLRVLLSEQRIWCKVAAGDTG